MSDEEITGYYNLMSDEVSFNEDDEADHLVDTPPPPVQHVKPRAASNSTFLFMEESTGNTSIQKADPVAGLNLPPKGSILKRSSVDSNAVDDEGEHESSLNHLREDGESVTVSRKSRVSFNGRTHKRKLGNLWLYSITCHDF